MKKALIVLFLLNFSNIFSQNKIQCDKILKILTKNRILAQKGNSAGVIDTVGNVILDFKYSPPPSFIHPHFDISDKLFLTTNLNSNKLVLFNLETSKNIIKDFKNITSAYLMDNYAIIGEGKFLSDNKRYYIDCNGKKLFEIPKNKFMSFQRASKIAENKIRMTINPSNISSNEKKYVYVDTLGKKKITGIFFKAGDFSNNLAINSKVINGNNYFGFIDEKGNQKIDFIYSYRPTDFSDNYSRVKNKQKKYGYINTQGKIVIPPQYDYASGFYKGYALVKNDNKNWKLINKKGETFKEFHKVNSFTLINLKSSTFGMKQIEMIKQIIDEGIFRARVGFKEVTMDIEEKIIFNQSKIRVGQFKNGLAVFSYYDKIKGKSLYGVINKKKRVILLNKLSEF